MLTDEVSKRNYVSHPSLTSGGSNMGIHAVYVIGWANNEGSACVNDSLAATITGHSLSIDGNTVRSNSRSRISRSVQCVAKVLLLSTF